MNIRVVVACTLGLAAASQAQAICYTVYDRANQVVYQAQTPPVDMSQPLREAIEKKYPGGHLVHDMGNQCPVENVSGQPSPIKAAAARAGGSTPLLTDRRTADAMGLQHAPLGNGVVIVPQRPANMRPGLNVIDAGPGGESSIGTTDGPVITEMYDPPITAVQRGGRTTVMGGPPAR